MKRHGLVVSIAALVGAIGVPAAAAQPSAGVSAAEASSRPAAVEPSSAGAGLPGAALAHQGTLQAPDIPVADVMSHLRELQQIARSNGGNRAASTSGYQASLNYVRSRLEAAGYSTHVQQFRSRAGISRNLIATYPGADPSDEVLMVGAHLDSVRAGPGINDNGSGTSAVLEVALTLAERNVDPEVTLRFAWWGAEELGLVGSRHYVRNLSGAELRDIAAYLNADMVGSPNAGYFVYGGAGIESVELQATFTEYFSSIGVPTEGLDISGRSDHAPFLNAGVPAAGASTGAGARKTPAQARKWGGTAGRPFDPCYHQACDTVANINRTALNRMSDAFGYTVWQLVVAGDDGDGENPPPDTGTWEPYTSYQVGDHVTYGGQEYVCRIAHTSLPGWEPPNTPALWQPV